LCALRYGNIEGNKVDEVDIEDAVMVSPASARRVPFFTGAQDEKEI
jgi:hypothetical protein